MHVEHTTCLCVLSQGRSWAWGRLHSWSARGPVVALTSLLCHFLSAPASGSGVSEAAWVRGGLGSKEASTGLRRCLRIHLFLSSLYFSHYHLVPCTLLPPAITTLLSMTMSPLFLFVQSLFAPPTPDVSLLSIYESVSIFLVSAVFSSDFTDEWKHMVFVCLWLPYFT